MLTEEALSRMQETLKEISETLKELRDAVVDSSAARYLEVIKVDIEDTNGEITYRCLCGNVVITEVYCAEEPTQCTKCNAIVRLRGARFSPECAISIRWKEATIEGAKPGFYPSVTMQNGEVADLSLTDDCIETNCMLSEYFPDDILPSASALLSSAKKS